MMTGNEIRRKFLEYFQQHGHKIVHSSPLLPANDPTLLFTNAGMNQFKDVFTGQEKRDYTRATSSQKCIRAGGKHNDLDEVGKTARHHTFFEMLGNFSFGDYFKCEAINFAWDFLVNELKLEENRLWFTVFEGDAEVAADDEARALWEEVGARPERILGFGRKDNFWQMGDTGPCGPCSEIHYYMGDEPDNPEKNHPKYVNGEGDATMEIWNLVFMQFERSEIEKDVYKLTPLPAPSVDTGAGLERMAAVLQGVKTNYDTDLLLPIINFTALLTVKNGIVYPTGSEIVVEDGNYKEKSIYRNFDEQKQFACRVIADHARATAFAIADGILPGNEGRNYVLRKIMRRAIYQGREHLGFNEPFFYKVCDFVVGQMHDAYPELEIQREFISKMARLEEERFGATMTVGLQKLNEFFAKNSKVDYLEFAKLYDTFGTPRDLVRVKLEEQGIEVNENDFNKKFDEAIADVQKQSAIGKTRQPENTKRIYLSLAQHYGDTEFTGYEETGINNALIVALIKGDEETNRLIEGEEGVVVLNRTPFYAESGGQVGDTGILTTQNGAVIRVLDTFAPVKGLILHKVKVEKGEITHLPTTANVSALPESQWAEITSNLPEKELITATVDAEKRDATRRNHTATHLVHAALREVLGTHVKQAGSVVAPQFLRFDFTHYQPISESELREIEDLVNREILKNDPVNTDLMSIEDAMRTGAMALFGEKYGSQVRVLSVGGGDFSRELCGGTHVSATGDIGSFKIMADEAVASGVRRIRAITGLDAFARFREDEHLIEKSLGALRTQRDNLPLAIEKLQEELKKARRENDDLKMKIATGAIGGAAANGDEAKDVAGVKVIAKTVDGLDKGGMRHLSDTLMSKIKSGVVVLAKTDDGKVSFIVRVSDDLTGKVKAGEIVKSIAPIVGGKGGGKPDMAEGGGTDAGKLNDALQASYGLVEQMLS